MADRTAAGAFGDAFAWQAKHRKPGLTKWLWSLTDEYDFSPSQMHADMALVKLGLVNKSEAELDRRDRDRRMGGTVVTASLDPLFSVFRRDFSDSNASQEEKSTEAKRSAKLARLTGHRDPLAASSKRSSASTEEKWVARTSVSDPTVAARAFAPVKASAATNAQNDLGRFVSHNKLLVAGAATVALLIAIAPSVANAASAPTPLTPEQQAQAAADARAASDRMNAIKIAAGLFAVTAAATIVYVALDESSPTRRSGFAPISLY